MNHLEKKISEKKKESSMEQDITDNSEKVKGELKQKGKVFILRIVTVIYSVAVIYFLFEQLTEFVVMVDYNIKYNILKYFFK